MQKPLTHFLFEFLPIIKFDISGHSMEPTYKKGDVVLVNKLSYIFTSPQIGDIVVAKLNGKNFIKRIKKIKNKKYFLAGDNSEDSLDSSNFGMIGKKDIVGKVI